MTVQDQLNKDPCHADWSLGGNLATTIGEENKYSSTATQSDQFIAGEKHATSGGHIQYGGEVVSNVPDYNTHF